MAKGSNTGAMIFLAILAIAGLGLSGYMFINNQFLGGDEVTFPGDLRLVAIWDDLDENLTNNPSHITYDDFLIAYDDEKFLDTNYITTVNNTRFQLVPGIYKINLDVLLYGIDASSTFWVQLNVNDIMYAFFERLSTSSSIGSNYYYVSSNLYINNTNGNNYFEINARGYSDFSVATDADTPKFNQLSIEYVIQ